MSVATSVYHSLFARMPSAAKAGRHAAVRRLLVAGDDFQEAVQRTNRRDDLTAKGKANALVKDAKVFAGSIRRARHQLTHLEKQIANDDASIREKVIGPSQDTDREWRDYLRGLPVGERTQVFLRDPAARSAALRQPGLSGLAEEILTKGLEIAVGQNAPDEAARLAVDREVATILRAALDAAAGDVMRTPLVAEESGNVRPFNSIREVEVFITTEGGTFYPKDLTLAEVEIDAVAAE